MNNIMVDLETLGTEPGCIVMSIGAVKFDLESGKLGETFYQVIDREESEKIGLTASESTLQWWEKQSDEAKRIFNHPMRVDPLTAIVDFDRMVNAGTVLWGNGAAFDNVILEAVYRALERPVPWKFWNSLCYRTVKTIAPMLGADAHLMRVGTHHNALDDAVTQARHMCDLWAALRHGRARNGR
jgi:hypothetical protein